MGVVHICNRSSVEQSTRSISISFDSIESVVIGENQSCSIITKSGREYRIGSLHIDSYNSILKLRDLIGSNSNAKIVIGNCEV